MNKYIDASAQCDDIWILYHRWYATQTDNQARSILKHCPKLLKHSRKETKRAFYSEMKKKSAYKHLAHLMYLDEQRFNALSDVFHDQMRVDLEFARRTIYSCLRATNHLE